MDSGSAIVGAIIIAICIVPFLMMYYNRVKKENKMMQTLNEKAQQHNCKISQHEFCGDFVIGIDVSRNSVFFLKQKKDEAISQFVDLAEIRNCQIYKSIKDVKGSESHLYSVQKVELIFLPTSENKGQTKFELYNEDVNSQLSGEIQFGEKWMNQIKDCLKNKM